MSCSVVVTIDTPKLEPSLLGFITRGKLRLLCRSWFSRAVADKCCSCDAFITMPRGVLIPAFCKNTFCTALSMPRALANTLEPTKGIPSVVSMPCMRPSSPKRPCCAI